MLLVTPEQYLEYDRNSEFKNEYHYGEILCMAGRKPRHSLVATNMAGELYGWLSGTPCRVYGSDLRVCLNKKLSYVYPDVTVVCGALTYVDDSEDTITNPKIAVEVLSPSTRNRDLGEKSRSQSSTAARIYRPAASSFASPAFNPEFWRISSRVFNFLR